MFPARVRVRDRWRGASPELIPPSDPSPTFSLPLQPTFDPVLCLADSLKLHTFTYTLIATLLTLLYAFSSLLTSAIAIVESPFYQLLHASACCTSFQSSTLCKISIGVLSHAPRAFLINRDILQQATTKSVNTFIQQ